MMDRKTILLFLVLLSPSAQIATHIYHPSLTFIADEFHIHHTMAQLSISLYMYSFALSSLIFGLLSDAYGRRYPILVGLTIFCIGGAVCCVANSMEMLIAGRVIQGFGGGGALLARTIGGDICSGNELAKLGSYLMMGSVGLVAGAPLLGGYLQTYFSWHANFYFLVGFGALLFLFCLIAIPETNTHKHPDNIKPRVFMKSLKTILSNKKYVGYTLCIACAHLSLLAWFTAAPVLLMDVLFYSPIDFGWVFAATSIFFMTSSFINSCFVMRVGADNMLQIGLALTFSSGLIMLGCALMGYVNLLGIVGPMCLHILGAGMIYANALSRAISIFPKVLGIAAALLASMQLLGGALGSTIAAAAPETDQLPLALIILADSGASLLFFYKIVRQ